MGDMSQSEKKKLKNLRKFRDGHRKFVQKTIEDAKGLITQGNPIEVKRLKFLRTALETKYSELQSLDREIVDLVDDVKVTDTVVCESCELMSSIQECIVELESLLEAQESKEKSQKSPSVVQPVSLESAGTSQVHVSKVFTHAKSPKLELKKFHGNPMQWYPFWESFESAVHKNPNLSSVAKFNYLKSLLTCTAQSSVAGLALTSANYEKAVDLLKQRFGNRQIMKVDLGQNVRLVVLLWRFVVSSFRYDVSPCGIVVSTCRYGVSSFRYDVSSCGIVVSTCRYGVSSFRHTDTPRSSTGRPLYVFVV